METVTRISKPHLVDFLRQADKNRWVLPRIRYASIRSKPELCHDIVKHFRFEIDDDTLISFFPRYKVRHFPQLQYDLHARTYRVDGVQSDFPRISREKPQFLLVRRPVTLSFGGWWPRGQHDSGTALAVASMFP